MKIDELMQKYNCQSVDFLNIDFGNDNKKQRKIKATA